jgi:multicomponent Na+:H+ antiporter subunit A
VSAEALHVAIILSPFMALPAAGWLGARGRRQASMLALLPAALTAYFARTLWLVGTTGPFTVSVPWAPSLHLSLSFHLDGLSALFAMVVCAVGTVIVVYATSYLDGHAHAGRFQVWLFAFMGSMLGLVLSDNILALFVFWELTGFTSYLLIGFEHDRPEARRAATQALIVTGGGGLALLAAAILLVQAGGTASVSELVRHGSLAGHPQYAVIVCLILLAAFTKSAQFPFHFWLPNAMEAPTPVSAYLHSATMVKAGVYLVARMTPLLGGTLLWTGTVVVVGAVAMIGGSYRALLETDLKRVLAYSTIGALGVMMLLFGAGTPQAVTAGLLYLLAHACYKGALFLMAGAVEHETGTRDVTALGGLRRTMPVTAVAAALAAASMVGLPLTVGFIAKEQFYGSLTTIARTGAWAFLLPAAAVAASACLGAAGLIAGLAPFVGRRTPWPAGHEAPASLWLGPLVLGTAGLVVGLVPRLVAGPVGLATASVIGAPAAVDLAIWHGFSAVLMLSAITLAGAMVLFAYRDALRRRAWPRALRTERLYSGTLAGIEAISRWMAPALQSASLRTYVLVVLVTGVTLVTTGLVVGRIFPTPSRWTPIHLHEGVVAALMVAGALAAVFARSTMAAVLSLGAMGYSVALMYALVGAPDLAMTQFAVETLTVVIFVLVFFQLRGFGDLSSRAVKTRDALVALAAGALVTTLVLFIGASGTTSRLSSYFADAAPRLAHGRNVVNVILVDFRGFDTMGEITVLVTVAIGVRALLLIGRERRP